MNEIAIRVENLSKCYQIYDQPHQRLLQGFLGSKKKYYKEFWALKEVSFKIKKGETVGIIGRNGSGKSTLLQIICGTLTPSDGTVETFGRIAALLELGSGFNPEFTGKENVYMNAAVLGLNQEEIDARYRNIVDFADIGEFIKQPVKTYSSGMMVRLAFAVIAHVDADILVIDEALAVGDVFFTQKCMRFLRTFMDRGTVLFVSHDTGSIKNLCSHAIWIEAGQVLQEGSPKEICESYLQAYYEANQGTLKSTSAAKSEYYRSDHPVIIKDQRLDFINNSNLRNDLKIFEFKPETSSFGKGGAQIINVEFFDQVNHKLNWVVGGEKVTLRIQAKTYETLDSPILGFVVKDRLGQDLFGDNTYLSYRESPAYTNAGLIIQAEFTFNMPILPIGDYSILVAIANGTQDQHVQHHWIFDAIIFKSESTSISTGLIGIPMQHIDLKCL